MRAIDDHAIHTVGILPGALMETAGRAVAAEARAMLGGQSRARVLVLVGKGNNGGDGLVAARVLADSGLSIQVLYAAAKVPDEGPASANLKAAQALGIPITFLTEATDISEVVAWEPDLCIDALLGVGARGAPTGLVKQVIDVSGSLPCPVLAVDVPSGLDAGTGLVPGACIRAAVTVTFGAPKVGLYSDPGGRYAGAVKVVDIGFPRASIESVTSRTRLLDEDLIGGWLPERPRWSHKGSTGTVVVIAGSAGMLGAAALCSRATLRAGAGLTKLVVPESLVETANALNLEVICHPAPEGHPGSLGPNARDKILALTQGARAVAIGPGLGTYPGTSALVLSLLQEIEAPMVIDADALNILAESKDTLSLLARLKAPAILTPHPGEMGRLSWSSSSQVQADRIGSASRLAWEFGVVVVLKGTATVVANPDGDVLINSTGNAGMATAGMGDVLTGTVAGLLAQGMQPLQAAGAGVFLHGMAGDLVAGERGTAGLLASDVIDHLPHARDVVHRTGR